MKLANGTKMRRSSDGVAGTVEMVFGESRICYLEFGESKIAPRSERWEPSDPPSWPLRDEEKLDVALAADAMLRSIVMHQPNRYWEPPSGTAFDPGLVHCVVAYLGTRT
jgi:hypothetical protein